MKQYAFIYKKIGYIDAFVNALAAKGWLVEETKINVQDSIVEEPHILVVMSRDKKLEVME